MSIIYLKLKFLKKMLNKKIFKKFFNVQKVNVYALNNLIFS